MDRHNSHFSTVETELSDLLRQRTGYEVSDLDREATFLELGFDSLFLIQFSQELKQRFGVKVTFRQLIEEVTSVDALISHIVDLQPTPAAASGRQETISCPAPVQQRHDAPAPLVTAQPVVAQVVAPPAPAPVFAPACAHAPSPQSSLKT